MACLSSLHLEKVFCSHQQVRKDVVLTMKNNEKPSQTFDMHG